jgi:hypothetical protein
MKIGQWELVSRIPQANRVSSGAVLATVILEMANRFIDSENPDKDIRAGLFKTTLALS